MTTEFLDFPLTGAIMARQSNLLLLSLVRDNDIYLISCELRIEHRDVYLSH